MKKKIKIIRDEYGLDFELYEDLGDGVNLHKKAFIYLSLDNLKFANNRSLEEKALEIDFRFWSWPYSNCPFSKSPHPFLQIPEMILNLMSGKDYSQFINYISEVKATNPKGEYSFHPQLENEDCYWCRQYYNNVPPPSEYVGISKTQFIPNKYLEPIGTKLSIPWKHLL